MSDILEIHDRLINGVHHRVEIIPDPDPVSPREGDNLGVMVYRHRTYVLGDEMIRQDSMDEYLAAAGLDPNDVVSLPLYLLDHSGLRLSTQDFGDPWDSGCVGAIYTTRQRIRTEYGSDDDEAVSKAVDVLRQEVSCFDDYVSGNTTGVRHLTSPDGDTWTEQDSVWGFLGTDMRTNGMIDHLPPELAAELQRPTTRPAPR